MPSRPHPRARTAPPNAPNAPKSHDPSAWLGFSLPPRVPGHGAAGVPGSGVPGPPPRRSRRTEGWRGGPMSREKYLNASFKFMLKPTEVLSYGAHFADPDIPLHWPNILQILVPTFSALSVAQGYVASSADATSAAFEGVPYELEESGEVTAERRRRIEEEKQGRQCPICLSKPVAGRMTKCGHIFCFPCILHFIQLSDIPKSAKCPICGDMVQTNMLKSVKYLDAEGMLGAEQDEDSLGSGPVVHAPPPSGFEDSLREAKALDSTLDTSQPEAYTSRHKLHMRLIQRPQMTTLALPSSPTWPSDAVPPHTAPWYFLPDIITYSRYMLATSDYMMHELSRELGELRREWDLLRGDELGRVFVRAAMDKVEGQMEKVKMELEADLAKRSERKGREAWAHAVGGERLERERIRERERKEQERIQREQEQEVGDVPVEFLASQQTSFDNSANINIPPNLPVTPNPMPDVPPKKHKRRSQQPSLPPPPTPPSQSYYFYQSSLGTNVFLHPLDIRILLAHFVTYSSFPPALTFDVQGWETATITEDLRKRSKYLSHLPVGTEVVFIETDLSALVSPATLSQFDQPLKARRQKRKDKVRKEDRAKARWEKVEKDRVAGEVVPSVRSVPSAFVPGGVVEDDQLEMVLERSMREFEHDFPPTAPQSYPQPGRQPSAVSSSPPTAGAPPWGTAQSASASASEEQRQRSFATALHRRYNPTTRMVEEFDPAWEAFEALNVGGEEVPRDVRETERGGGQGAGRKKKKEKGKTLVLGGGGGRRA
ncbi:hypothetical protein B9479_003021 [Cryptococcus floricola]|uniref:RING-type domain-containing protein n=1 Tax=Cryptococcus floricola TaxID=2591691 RepID=A0A5D3B1J7_9TREE|nr:hypothetical protein B9479_003021 [Cryptococcus floricola]